MGTSTGQLSIFCVEVGLNYTLRFKGADWSESCPSIEAAIRRAGELVVEETSVTVYDSTGHGIVVTTLFPLQKGLSEKPAWAEELLEKHPDGNALAHLKTSLATDGVRGAVQFLNSLTPHRFTSLYLFDGPTLRSITFYDRQNPGLDSCEDIPVEASYCVFVRDTAKTFVIPDASLDERVQNHPKRETVKRYCGVPLLDKDGKMFGSICHFDLEPGHIANQDVELLERMAELLRPSFEMRAGLSTRSN